MQFGYSKIEQKYIISLAAKSKWNENLLLPEQPYSFGQRILNVQYIKDMFKFLFIGYNIEESSYIHNMQINGLQQGKLKFSVFITMFIDTEGPETLCYINIYIDPKEDGKLVFELLRFYMKD